MANHNVDDDNPSIYLAVHKFLPDNRLAFLSLLLGAFDPELLEPLAV